VPCADVCSIHAIKVSQQPNARLEERDKDDGDKRRPQAFLFGAAAGNGAHGQEDDDVAENAQEMFESSNGLHAGVSELQQNVARQKQQRPPSGGKILPRREKRVDTGDQPKDQQAVLPLADRHAAFIEYDIRQHRTESDQRRHLSGFNP
jgi:hypothetical protein